LRSPRTPAVELNRRCDWHAIKELLLTTGIAREGKRPEATMQGIIYLVGLVVVILAILSFFGLR
jgi:hypothetical protein